MKRIWKAASFKVFKRRNVRSYNQEKELEKPVHSQREKKTLNWNEFLTKGMIVTGIVGIIGWVYSLLKEKFASEDYKRRLGAKKLLEPINL
jgi:hypothetical protein